MDPKGNSQTPLEHLELALIDEFLHERGYDHAAFLALGEADRQKLLAEASTYASGRLMEVEARSHYIHDIHDGGSGILKTGLD